MQTIDKQRLIEWAKDNQIKVSKTFLIDRDALLSFIEQETSESDVLQEGDYFVCESPDQAMEAFVIENICNDPKREGERAYSSESQIVFFEEGELFHDPIQGSTKTELSLSEFLRRARNTFKKK